MTGGSDAERKGHKRKLADALQPAAINLLKHLTGEPTVLAPQVWGAGKLVFQTKHDTPAIWLKVSMES